MAAASGALDDHGLTDHAESLRRLTRNASSADPFKIEHQRHSRGHDYERFGDVMLAAADGARSRLVEGPLGDCYRFFHDTIDAWLAEQADQLPAAGAALATTLAQKLRVVAIYLDAHEKEHAIFESLNARGEPLTEWDKIKNYLLYKSEEDPSLSQEVFFERYLDGFDDPWWRELVGRGVQRPRADVFVDYWLEAKKVTSVAVRRVFREFQAYVDGRDGRLEELMDELLEDARYYRKSEAVDPGVRTREALFHRRRLTMGAGAVWPLLLRIRNLDIGQAEKERCLEVLESYLVRRAIAGYQARSYDQVALELVGMLAVDGNAVGGARDAMRGHLLAYSENANLWPSDQALSDGVLERTLPRYAQRLVLTAVEQSLITERAGIPEVPAGVHVEHIMPQGWQPATWPLPVGIPTGDATQHRERVIGTLGNLTLLNGRLNSSLSNSGWDVKRTAIEKSDNLFLNRHLLRESSGDEWSEEQIGERGQWMCGIILKTWPR